MDRIKYVTYNAMGLKDTQIQHYYKSGDFKNCDKITFRKSWKKLEHKELKIQMDHAAVHWHWIWFT